MIFVGDDWADDHHDVVIMDEAGATLAYRRFPEGVEGVGRLHTLVAEHAQDAAQVAVGIETDRGLWALGKVTAPLWRWIAPVSRKLSRLRPFFLKRGKWTWGPGRLPARLSQNARIPRSRSRKASCGTHLLTSGHQGTPSGPFFQLFHSRCWLIAEGKGTVLSPARRASRAARSRSNPQSWANREAPAWRKRLRRCRQLGSGAKRNAWRTVAIRMPPPAVPRSAAPAALWCGRCAAHTAGRRGW